MTNSTRHSTAIALYLDAKHQQPALLPADPQARGRAILFDEYADTLLANSARTVGFNRHIGPSLLGIEGDASAADAAEKRAGPLLDWLEDQIGDGWLAGDAYSLGDIAVACCLRTLAYGMDVATRPRTANGWTAFTLGPHGRDWRSERQTFLRRHRLAENIALARTRRSSAGGQTRQGNVLPAPGRRR